MAAAAAALLDELMGRNRNLPSDSSRSELHWSDADVCKHFLCGFCPNELFVNTRADLGVCSKLHDDAMKKEYEKSSRHEKMGYEEDFIRFLQSLISDVERRIRRGHQRLTFNMAQANLSAGGGSKDEKVQMLTERINELVTQAEGLGCEGKVEEAQGVMKLCEKLKDERSMTEMMHTQNDMPGVKQMEVCEICGALLIVGDAEQRVQEHLMGKQHMGYAQVRATVDEHLNKKKNVEQEREDRLRLEREEREKEREKEREERKKEREKEDKKRKRSRSRSRRSRSRDRKRSRSRDRRRSRSRDRKRSSRRSGSRERSRRSRSRDRSKRSRSRDRRSRHRSKSRDRHRDRSRDRKSRDDDKKSRKSKDRSEDKKEAKVSENGDSSGQTPVSGEESAPAKMADSQEEQGAGDAPRDLSQGD